MTKIHLQSKITPNSKIDFTLMPPEFLDVVKVLQKSAETGKYSRNGWLEGKGWDYEQNLASMQRHLLELWRHDTVDGESGLHPALHLACRALMLYVLHERGVQVPPTQKENELYARVNDYWCNRSLRC